MSAGPGWANFAGPRVDLASPLLNLFQLYQQNYDQSKKQAGLDQVASAIQSGKGVDYNTLASTIIRGGDLGSGLGLLKMGQTDAADKAALGAIFGGSTPSAPAAATSPSPIIQSGDQKAFAASIMPLAIEASKKTGIDPRLIVAQAALETGWGRSAPGNNLFGIKGPGQTLETSEVVGGQPQRTMASFRAFGSPQEATDAYVDLISRNQRYGPVRAAQGLEAQAAALGKSGYATDPAYGQKVLQIAQGLTPGAPSDVPAAGSQPAQFAIPGQGGQPTLRLSATGLENVSIPKLVAAGFAPGLSQSAKDTIREVLKAKLEESKMPEDAKLHQWAVATGQIPQGMDFISFKRELAGDKPTTVTDPYGNLLQHDPTTKTWKPLDVAGVTRPAGIPATANPKTYMEEVAKKTVAEEQTSTERQQAAQDVLPHLNRAYEAYKRLSELGGIGPTVASGPARFVTSRFHTEAESLRQEYEAARSELELAKAQIRLKGQGQITEGERALLRHTFPPLEASDPKTGLKTLDLVRSEVTRAMQGQGLPTRQVTSQGTQTTGAASAVLDQARDAISRGASREAVIERLRANGIDPSRL